MGRNPLHRGIIIVIMESMMQWQTRDIIGRNPLHRGIIIVIVASAGSIYEDVGCVASNFKTDFPFLGLFLAFGRKGKKGGFIILEFCKNTKKVSIFAPPKSPK